MSTESGTPLGLFVIGAPGSGKSTVTRLLAAMLGISSFQSGQAFRQAAEDPSDQGLQSLIRRHMSRHRPMPVSVYCRVVAATVEPSSKQGVVFDGYPRNEEQCQRLPSVLAAAGIPGAHVIGFILDVPDDVIASRVVARLVCRNCGKESPPLPAKCCPGADLVRRNDDTPDALRTRTATFRALRPAIETYFRTNWVLHSVCAEGRPQEVAERLSRLLTSESTH